MCIYIICRYDYILLYYIFLYTLLVLTGILVVLHLVFDSDFSFYHSGLRHIRIDIFR